MELYRPRYKSILAQCQNQWNEQVAQVVEALTNVEQKIGAIIVLTISSQHQILSWGVSSLTTTRRKIGKQLSYDLAASEVLTIFTDKC